MNGGRGVGEGLVCGVVVAAAAFFLCQHRKDIPKNRASKIKTTRFQFFAFFSTFHETFSTERPAGTEPNCPFPAETFHTTLHHACGWSSLRVFVFFTQQQHHTHRRRHAHIITNRVGPGGCRGGKEPETNLFCSSRLRQSLCSFFSLFFFLSFPSSLPLSPPNGRT